MEQALPIAKSLILDGLDETMLPDHAKKDVHDKTMALLDTCEKDVMELLKKNRKALDALATELQKRETMSAKEVAEVIGSVK